MRERLKMFVELILVVADDIKGTFEYKLQSIPVRFFHQTFAKTEFSKSENFEICEIQSFS